MKTTKELADELDAQDRLKKRGYTKVTCERCEGIGMVKDLTCISCRGKGYHWMAPLMG